jgi:hypothetical protein
MRHSVQQSGRRSALIACRCGTKLSDQAVTLEMDRRIVRMCGCRAVYKAVVLRFDVVDAHAEQVRDAAQQHAQRAAELLSC